MELWVKGPWVMFRTDHLFPLQELLDPLHQRGEIMEPEGGSLALYVDRYEMWRKVVGVILLSPDSAGFT